MSICAVLPEEVMVDILSRLPAKSLCRFKCISKSWFTLISNPHFTKTHLNRSNHNKRERLFFISDSLYCVDCTEASNNDAVIATKLDFPSIEDPHRFNEVFASCNGLLLVGHEEGATFLLNPSTRESKILPKYLFIVDSPSRCRMYGLGYDSSTDNYKVVAVSYCVKDDDPDYDYEDSDSDYDYDFDDYVSVYSLKTNSWRRIQDFPYDHSLLVPDSGVFVNGSIHWLTYRHSDHSPVIAAFDVTDEKFRDVLAPTSIENLARGKTSSVLRVLGGCLCQIIRGSATRADLWVMKEYGVNESWTKFTIYIPHPYNAWPLCLLQDREVLLPTDGDELVAFNAKEKRLRYIMVHGMPARFDEAETYVESIVSPFYHYGIEKKYKRGEISKESSTI